MSTLVPGPIPSVCGSQRELTLHPHVTSETLKEAAHMKWGSVLLLPTLHGAEHPPPP